MSDAYLANLTVWLEREADRFWQVDSVLCFGCPPGALNAPMGNRYSSGEDWIRNTPLYQAIQSERASRLYSIGRARPGRDAGQPAEEPSGRPYSESSEDGESAPPA